MRILIGLLIFAAPTLFLLIGAGIVFLGLMFGEHIAEFAR